MKLTIEPYNQNKYTISGFVIFNSSPKVWLEELKRMNIGLNSIQAFPLPSNETNSVSGLLVLKENLDVNVEFASCQKVQSVNSQLLIPELTKLNVELSKDEVSELFGNTKYYFHPQLGLIPLEKQVIWSEIIQVPTQNFLESAKPANTVRIPNTVESFSIEVDEKELEMKNPFGLVDEKEEKPPFNLEKLLKGNHKEVDKFLKFMDKNPEAALKYAVPMDLLGTSRGKAMAKYKFGGGFNLFGSSGSGGLGKASPILIGIVIIGLIFFGVRFLGSNSNQESIDSLETIVYESENFNDIPAPEPIEEIEQSQELSDEPIQVEPPQASFQSKTPNVKTNEFNQEPSDKSFIGEYGSYIWAVLIMFIIGLLIFLYLKSIKKKKQSMSWINLSEEDELFQFKEQKQKKSFFYFGENVSVKGKIIMTIIVIIAICLVLVPMLMNGIGFWDIVVILIIVWGMHELLLDKEKKNV